MKIHVSGASMTRIIIMILLLIFGIGNVSAQQPVMGGGPGGGPGPGAGGSAGAGVLITPGSQLPGSQTPGTQSGTRQGGQNPQVPGAGLVASARLETRTTTIGVAGRLEPARRLAHTVSLAGFVDTIHVRVGDRVTVGQALVTISREIPGEVFRPLIVTSRIAGRISELHLIEGDRKSVV